jgi:beta-glucosidase
MTEFPHFPPSFEWGCATAAFQIEGGATEGGKLPSIWDHFCAQPGRIKDASDGLVACDHFHRYPEDIALMADLGFRHYRFSIAWTRVVREDGSANPEGLDFYRRLLSALHEKGITPNATLFHWDLPAHLQRQHGGWLDRETAHRFADYAQIVARELGDLLPRVATLNEPWCSAFLGHDLGVFAPGVQDRPSSLLAAHHLMLAHGLGLQAWRSVRSDTQLGIVLNPELCDAASDAPQDVAAARLAELERNDVFINPLFGREWPAEMIEQIGPLAGQRLPGDLAATAQPLDFIGLNYYTRSIAQAPVSADEQRRGYRFVPPERQRPDLTDIGWEIHPQGLERVTRNLLAQWPLPPIWITENGAADNTPVVGDACDDRLRLGYLQSHLDQLSHMVASGIDIRGYYVWSLLDNFEWAHGYSQRFGIVHVDYATQRRTPKASARWLQQQMISRQP